MIRPNADPRVWNVVRWLYIGSGILFLANISLGILNVFSGEVISRGQLLAHFHAGTIGWITLSVIATALWVFSSQGPASDQYVFWAKVLTIIGLTSVAGYISAFGTVFNVNDMYWMLPLFGIPTWAVIVGGFLFTALTLKRQVTVTTVHLLLFGALLVASLGATMGVLWGLTLNGVISPYPAGSEPIGAHAAPMDMYLALAFAAFLELFLRKDDHARWTRPGMWQMVLGVAAAFLVAGGTFFGFFQIAPLALGLFLASFVIYLIRIGWRAFVTNPASGGRSAAVFFGGIFFPVYVLLFVVFVFVFFIPDRAIPHWLEVLFMHTTFVGAGTNLILAVQSSYGGHEEVAKKLEPWAYWILNVGMLLFFAGVFFAGDRNAALIMAVGVLLGLYVAWARLGRSWEAPGTSGGPPPGVDPARPPSQPSTPPGEAAPPEEPGPALP